MGRRISICIKRKQINMTVTILNRNNGSVTEMRFANEDQKQSWLQDNPIFECLGKLETELPTRHVRMKGK